MRSDCQEIPDGFTKEDADKAETMEARRAADSGEMTPLAAPGCQVYWPAPYEVCGAIRDKYNALGGPNSFLLFPTSNELTNPDGVGKRSTFQNGPIYWSPWGGAHPVVNHFFAAWQRNGWEGGVLGYPTSDEYVNPDGIGRRQYFDGGTIYWKTNEAYYVAGAIRDKWEQTGWEQGFLGYPISDETATADGVGRFNRFENGYIYWHPSFGAYVVRGGILDQWAAAGFETSTYGYPTADEIQHAGIASEQQFQNGVIYNPKKAAAAAKYGDYFQDTGMPQCSKPLAQREGAWACPNTTGTTAGATGQAREISTGTYCLPTGLGGCWHVYDDFKADYAVKVFFGRGPEVIGSGDALIEWTLSGPYTNVPRARIVSNDVAIGRAIFRGALSNGAVGVPMGGSVIHQTQPQFAEGPILVGRPANLPDPSAMVLEDRRMDDHNYVVQISVEFSEYPGYWYFYARSPVAHYDEDDPNDIYRFQGPDKLPGNPNDAGWKW